MADYYVDTSQTFNGDGTVSTSAASDGEAGAANSFIEVMKGLHSTIGSLAGGSNVYVRTHDGTSDCSESYSANVNSNNSGSIDIYFDDGSIWANSGQFTLSCSNNAILSLSRMRVFAGDSADRRLKLVQTNTTTVSNASLYVFFSGYFRGIEIDGSASTKHVRTTLGSGYSFCEFVDILYKPSTTQPTYNSTYALFMVSSLGSATLVTGMEIDFGSYSGSEGGYLFSCSSSYGTKSRIYDVTVRGGNVNMVVFAQSTSTGNTVTQIEARNISIEDTEMGWVNNQTADFTFKHSLEVIGGNKGFGYYSMQNGAEIEFLDTDTTPALTSKLPDGNNTKWAYRVRIMDILAYMPVKLPIIEQAYSDTASTKTLTLEMLFNENLSPTQNDVFADFSYVDDTTGDIKTITSKEDITPLVTATALAVGDTTGWNMYSYGSEPMDAYKISVTTPTTIKQGTVIRAYVSILMKNTVSTRNIFFHPEMVLS